MKEILGFALLLLSTFTFTVQAQAPMECYRHSECADDEICVNTLCTPPAEPLSECASDDDCDADAFIPENCSDGFCKKNGVYCENPAGSCYYENDQTSCSCKGGMGGASMSTGSGSIGESTEPELTDEELYEQCQEGLVRDCGEQAPDIRDECSDEQLETCNAYYDQLEALQTACDVEEPEEPSFANLSSCCRHLDDEDFMEHYDCIMAIETDACDDMEDCYPDGYAQAGGTSGESSTLGSDSTSKSKDDDHDEQRSVSNEDGENEESEDEEDDDSGCTVSAGPRSSPERSAAGIVFLLGIVLAFLAVRRKRSYKS